MTSYLSYWYSGQVVQADQMNIFSKETYDRFAAMTNQNSGEGVILSLDSVSQAGSDVTVGNGSFRFPNTVWPDLPYNTAIFGSATSDTVTVSGDGYVVARYTIDTGTNLIDYAINVTYVFVATVNPITDCIICVITSGTISDYGKWYACSDIFDNPLTGSVEISGFATTKGAKTLYTSNDLISGGVPYSTVSTFVDGDYTQSNLYCSNGISSNEAIVALSYSEGGNSVYKPTLSARSQTPDGYNVSFNIVPTGAASNYEGFYSDITLNTPALGRAVLEFYTTSTQNAVTSWYVNDGSSTAGITLNESGTLTRPSFLGDLNTLTLSQDNDIVALFDFLSNSLTGGGIGTSGFQIFPGGLIVQWGQAVYNPATGGTGTVVTLPLTFPNAGFMVVSSDYGNGTFPTAATINDSSSIRIWASANGGSFAETAPNFIVIGW